MQWNFKSDTAHRCWYIACGCTATRRSVLSPSVRCAKSPGSRIVTRALRISAHPNTTMRRDSNPSRRMDDSRNTSTRHTTLFCLSSASRKKSSTGSTRRRTWCQARALRRRRTTYTRSSSRTKSVLPVAESTGLSAYVRASTRWMTRGTQWEAASACAWRASRRRGSARRTYSLTQQQCAFGASSQKERHVRGVDEGRAGDARPAVASRPSEVRTRLAWHRTVMY